jgi:hypothetical protein
MPRRGPVDSPEYILAKYQEDANWNFPKSKWAHKGLPEYDRLKKVLDKSKGKALEPYSKFLMEVHFPKIAPADHPASTQLFSNSSPRKRPRADPVFGDRLAQAIFCCCNFFFMLRFVFVA